MYSNSSVYGVWRVGVILVITPFLEKVTLHGVTCSAGDALSLSVKTCLCGCTFYSRGEFARKREVGV